MCTQLCPTLCNPTYCSPPGSSVYGIFQTRILEWVAISSSRECSWFRDLTHVSCTGRQILYCWDTREGPQTDSRLCKRLLRGGQLGDSHSSLRTTRWCRTKESRIFSAWDQRYSRIALEESPWGLFPIIYRAKILVHGLHPLNYLYLCFLPHISAQCARVSWNK